jgi:hypothetical protein
LKRFIELILKIVGLSLFFIIGDVNWFLAEKLW